MIPQARTNFLAVGIEGEVACESYFFSKWSQPPGQSGGAG